MLDENGTNTNPKTKHNGGAGVNPPNLGSRLSSTSALPLYFYTMKDAYYFPHDSNAQQDEKILKLRFKYGWEGYGLYWAIVEKLRDSSDYKLEIDNIGGLSLGLSHPIDTLKAFIEYCIDIGLFKSENGCFYSDSLTRRMAKIDSIRRKYSECGKAGATKRWGGYGKANSGVIAVKESKVKKSKVYSDTNVGNMIPSIIDFYKNLKGYSNVEDWDKFNYARHAKPAKLLSVMAKDDWKDAMKWTSEQGYADWTLETVAKKYADFRKSKQKKTDGLL